MILVPQTFYSSYTPASVLKMTGEDALAFLQGQFTQELRFPPGRLSAYGLWLNQKGKVLADSFALRDGEVWWLCSVNSPAELLRERLEAYIIADDVVIEDVTTAWRGIITDRGTAKTLLRGKGLKLPPEDEWVKPDEGFLFRGRRLTLETWEWLLPEEKVSTALDALQAEGVSEIDSVTLDRARVASGIPKIPHELGPSDLPQEAELEDAAISYSKGCYLGQEVVARLKAMGQVRRKLMPVDGVGLAPACPVPLYIAAKKVGGLRAAVPLVDGAGFIGLAMLSLIGLDVQKSLSLELDGAERVRVRPPLQSVSP